MPITILDYVKSEIGKKDIYSSDDFYRLGVEYFGDCEHCSAALGGWNAYPAVTGYWRCADCIADCGFDTVEEFSLVQCINGDRHCTDCEIAAIEKRLQDADLGIICPSCQDAAHIIEIRDQVFECGDCGAKWSTGPCPVLRDDDREADEPE